ncbi:MAG: OpgC domain-containing protein [Chloroflexota bacterium]|nr:OpgC domain-containing protein [Chloroflexota bacterium]
MLRWLRYQTTGKRDLRLDFIRGYCVFMMVVDHLSGPSLLYFITGNNRYIVSAAEGFVFISGIVMGLVYRPLAERRGFEEVCIRALGRAAQLYLLFVGLTLAMVGLSRGGGGPPAGPQQNTPPGGRRRCRWFGRHAGPPPAAPGGGAPDCPALSISSRTSVRSGPRASAVQ